MNADAKPSLSIRSVLRGTFAGLFGSYGWILLLSAFVSLTDIPGYVLPLLLSTTGESSAARLAWATVDLAYSFVVALPFGAFAFALAALVFERRKRADRPRAGLGESLGSARAALFPVMVAMLPLFAVGPVVMFLADLFTLFARGFASPMIEAMVFGAIPIISMVLSACLTLLFCAAPLSAALEKAGGRAALRRSIELTRGHRLAIFGLFLLLDFLPGLLSAASHLFGFLFDSVFWIENKTIFAAIETAVDKAFLAPLFWALSYALYVELKKRAGEAADHSTT